MRDVLVQYFLNKSPTNRRARSSHGDQQIPFFKEEKEHRQTEGDVGVGRIRACTEVGFLVPVDRRDAATLLPEIQRWVAPGSTIWTDIWAAYNNLPNLPQQYVHGTVNHTLNFVDPNTGLTTNRVESMWARVKAKFKKYFQEFLMMHTIKCVHLLGRLLFLFVSVYEYFITGLKSECEYDSQEDCLHKSSVLCKLENH